ncbi:MAG: transcriptional repressor [Candidatus Latescibacterota bacterium]|nr:MAG: transcriptional repressor [Candidatus Latescibacterota bacterium]
MDKKTKQKRVELFERQCRSQGVPFTVQRRAILETVLEFDNHPTAEQVHDAVTTRFPGISRTTVYRTLETLVQMGLITKACHPGSVVRYDRRIEVHHHLVCQRCEEVVDISDERLDALPVPDTSSLGFEVFDFRVQLRGICRRCRKKE